MVDDWRKQFPLHYGGGNAETLFPQYVVQRVCELTKDRETVICTEVGQNQMWACQFYTLRKPRTWVSSGGLGTMGFGLPAAIGAQVGRPDALVVDIAGDGSIQMNIQELATAKINGLPVKVVILNNGYLGMVRQWQELFYEKRYASSVLPQDVPDFVKLAEAYGCFGVRVTTPAELDAALTAAFDYDGPAIVDCRVEGEECVFPMVAPGRLASTRCSAAYPGARSPRCSTTSCSRRCGSRCSTHSPSLVENKPGVLTRVASLFARRGFNIDSLAVGMTEDPTLSRITIVCSAADTPIEQITKQLHKLINVIKVQDLDAGRVGRPRTRAVQGQRGARAAARDHRDRERVPRQDRRRGQELGDDRGHRRDRQARRDGGPAPRVRHQGAGAHRQDRARRAGRESALTADANAAGSEEARHGTSTTRRTATWLIKGRKIAVIGYGSQGHAHALNLHDSGVRRARRPAHRLAELGEGARRPGSRS